MVIGFNELLRDNLIGRSSEKFDEFGQALATGDFNNDGKDDLAIGVPNEEFGFDFPFPIVFDPDIREEGVVQVLYSSSGGGGFRDGSQELHQDNLAAGNAENDDGFGEALAVGDINGDNFDDLIVGIPGESGSREHSGALQVVFGSSTGLDRDKTQILGQDSAGIESQESNFEEFGSSFATADFNKDGFDDVAVGVPFNRDFTNVRAGGVNVIYGSPTGLNESRRGDQFFNRNTSGILGVDREGDRFGTVLATGDFDGDTHQDLAIGIPGSNFNGQNDAGAVTVVYGSSSGLTKRNSHLSQGDSDFPAPDLIEADDRLGSALAAADFNGDGITDLAMGAPGEDSNRGAVQIHYGRRGSNLPIGEQDGKVEFIRGNQFAARSGDRFGAVLAADDLNQDGFADLVVSLPGKDTSSSASNSGMVSVIFGSASGLANSQFRPFIQSPSSGLVDSPEVNDQFGLSLAVGNFNGLGGLEVAVGSGDSIGSADFAGAVTIIRSELLE